MRKEIEGGLIKIRYDSLNELADALDADRSLTEDWVDRPHFTGARDLDEALSLARDGWTAELERAMTVAEDAVSKVERDLEALSFVAAHDVAGCEVDVARYLDGTPENMIDYPLTPIVKAGKVITLCASSSASSAIDADTIKRRGQVVVALALALSRLGYSSEIYVEMTCSGSKKASIRTMVKGAADALDAERLMYALAHPSMLRLMDFGAFRRLPASWQRAIGQDSIGSPINPIEDLPDGTIYLPCVRSSYDVPDADEQLVQWLKDLEILPADYNED